jgi:hypothetical protein
MAHTISVRDHAVACEHGYLWSHWITVTNAKWWQEPECLGGREMILLDLGGGMWRELPTKAPRDAGRESAGSP